MNAGPVHWTNRDRSWDKLRSSLGQTGLFLPNCSVNSPACSVLPWDRWYSSLGQLSCEGHQRNAYEFVFGGFWSLPPPSQNYLCKKHPEELLLGGMRQTRVINYAREFSENCFLGSYVNFASFNMEEFAQPLITQNNSWGIHFLAIT